MSDEKFYVLCTAAVLIVALICMTVEAIVKAL